MKNSELTPKQEAFAQLVASNKTYFEAHQIAYPNNMSRKTRWEAACRLMDNSNVLARVEQLRNEIRESFIKSNQVTLEQVLEQMSNWIMFDPLEMVDPETDCIKSLKEMSKEVRMSIAEIQVTELFDNVLLPGATSKVRARIGELKKVKFVDKRATADMFMKKFGAYIENKNVTVDNLDAIREIIESVKGK